jgi:hypothetical protein
MSEAGESIMKKKNGKKVPVLYERRQRWETLAEQNNDEETPYLYPRYSTIANTSNEQGVKKTRTITDQSEAEKRSSGRRSKEEGDCQKR